MANFNIKHKENITILNSISNKIKLGNHSFGEYQMFLNMAYKHVKGVLPMYFTPDGLTPLSEYEDVYKALSQVEKACKNPAYILDTRPNFDYASSFYMEMPNTDSEQMPSYLINEAWQVFAYYYAKDQSLKNTSFINQCDYFSSMISLMCREYDIPCYEICINPGFLDTAELYEGTKYHKLCIVFLNGEYYLLDPSYRQFFLIQIASLKRIGIPFLDGPVAGAFMLLDSRRKALASTLISQGYIKLNSEVLKDYCDGFAMSFRNGLYYKEGKGNPYETSYSAEDYVNFLQGKDNQVKHEDFEVLERQRSIK